MLAQAPTVTNVQAEQTQGTKDVTISFELTGKYSGGATDSMIHGEVWFKESESKTTWTKVSSVGTIDQFSGTFTSANLSEWNPDTGTDTLYPTFDLGEVGLSPVTKSLIWKAGDDAPNINTSDAKIRIIAFYPKMFDEATPKPMSEQTSGWNGEGDFGASGGTPDGNGTGSPDGNGSAVDTDGDGFSDDEEIAAGSDPYNPSSFPGSNDPGSPDGNGSVVDSDGDGFSDEEEITAGSDPYNPSSFPGV
jgi:hypothetical protein